MADRVTDKQEKAPGAFRTISEVAQELDVPQHVLRFWESKFSQLKPVKRGGGRRYYRPEDLELIRAIRKLLYDDKFTIKGAQKLFRDLGLRKVVSMTAQDPDHRVAQAAAGSGSTPSTTTSSGTATSSGRAGKGGDPDRLHGLLAELRAARDLLSENNPGRQQ
ncbi:MAG: MerR family transcriptional regulator [Sphingomonadales bacterium]